MIEQSYYYWQNLPIIMPKMPAFFIPCSSSIAATTPEFLFKEVINFYSKSCSANKLAKELKELMKVYY